MESIAVVTGGAGGIGLATAAKLAQSHEAVFIVDINPDQIQQSEQHMDLIGSGRLRTYRCDVTQQTDVERMAESISSQGKVRTLVNNAGATETGSLQQMTAEDWSRELTLNLHAAFLCFHVFAEPLKQSHGSVVNIASVNGLGFYGNPAYSAAKAGLIHFTKSIAVEFGKFGVRANAVAPGTVRTAVWDAKVRENPRLFEEVMQFYPLDRVIQPEDVASAVAFLANDQAAAITGVCLPVDSGLTAGQPALGRAFSQSNSY
ncbi:Short chain dehydrogenase [Aspergillus sp. HF37]|nr:Short chain dehydrogenase [Aspergillus sp. HF37]